MIAVEDVVYKLVKTRRLIQEQDIETIPSKLPGKVMKLKIHEVRPYLDSILNKKQYYVITLRKR
jgi:hypothetical protein